MIWFCHIRTGEMAHWRIISIIKRAFVKITKGQKNTFCVNLIKYSLKRMFVSETGYSAVIVVCSVFYVLTDRYFKVD